MRRLVPVIGVAVLFACRDQSPSVPPVLEPSLPSAAIIDGGEGHGGNPFFFWLAPQWIYASFPGEANQDLSPTAAICRWDGSACVGADVAVFRHSDGTITTGTESDYVAVWKTWQANPRTNEVFRIRVFLGPYELGARGALLYAQGIDPSSCNDCAEGSVSADSDETTVIITPSGRAAAVIEPGSLPAGVNEVNIIIERLTSPCLPTDTQQYPACYRYLAVPDIEFAQDVVVGVCLESIASYAVGQVQLHKVKEIQEASGDWVPDGEVIPLPNVPATNITCGSPVILSAFARRHPRLARGVRAVAQPIAKLLGPNVAWADDEGFGGTTGSFSRVRWARGMALAIESGDGAQFTTGEGTVAAVVSVTATTGRRLTRVLVWPADREPGARRGARQPRPAGRRRCGELRWHQRGGARRDRGRRAPDRRADGAAVGALAGGGGEHFCRAETHCSATMEPRSSCCGGTPSRTRATRSSTTGGGASCEGNPISNRGS